MFDFESELVKATVESGILQITLNRPNQLNALNHEVLTQLSHLFYEASHQPTIKAILIHGEGKAFCAGADINELKTLSSTTGLAFARFGQSVFRQLECLGKPSLAAIHGYAFGGGCELAMATSLRFAADNTMLGQPEIKLGVIPGFGGTQRLSRLVGKSRAIDICLTGKRIHAQEALSIGLVNALYPQEEVIERSKSYLHEIIQYSPSALNSILTTIHHGYDLNLDDAFELEATHFGICCGTKDKHEGVAAFLEKRKPEFTGN